MLKFNALQLNSLLLLSKLELLLRIRFGSLLSENILRAQKVVA